MDKRLMLVKGGRLVLLKMEQETPESDWVWQEYDATPAAASMLWENCYFEKGLTLRDIFLLINTNLELFTQILGNSCDKIVEEGLLPKPDSDNDKSVTQLELYWTFIDNKDENEFTGHWSPNFHGLGSPDKHGKRTPYGVDASPANELAHIPIRLNDKATIYVSTGGRDLTSHKRKATFKLGDILHAIIWELSWWGPPCERDGKLKGLFPRAEYDVQVGHARH